MGEYVMTCSIFICLLLLALLALAKPLRALCRFVLSAAFGSALLLVGQSLGAEVGINGVTVLISGLLGLPGAGGMLLLSFLL
ncbi:MAG: pro-sigmaK processing inhibitor BofA family protein [Bacillota bacterium]|nr:pro-sigmaK processing inhibitor BofA family protein [Bacillota bacterium]